MDQLVELLCSCIKDNKVMEDADGDGIPDFMQKGKKYFWHLQNTMKLKFTFFFIANIQ